MIRKVIMALYRWQTARDNQQTPKGIQFPEWVTGEQMMHEMGLD